MLVISLMVDEWWKNDESDTHSMDESERQCHVVKCIKEYCYNVVAQEF